MDKGLRMAVPRQVEARFVHEYPVATLGYLRIF